MRIGLVYLGRRGPGGPLSFELASHLARKADLFAVVSQNADHIGLWRASGIPLVEASTFDTKLQAPLSCLNSRKIAALADQIAARKPDVIVYPMVHPWTPLLQSRLAGIPNIVTVHDPAAHPGFLHQMSSLWEAIAAQGAARCVVLSRLLVDEMRARGVAPERIDVIPHAMFSFYDGLAPLPSDGAADVLFFGRITAYKGLDVLIRAFRDVQARWPEAQLRIVGEGDLRRYARLLDGTKNITVTNRWVDDCEVGAFFRSRPIVAVPYTSASQSGVIALAASFGCPVIASRTGGLSDQIHDGDTGLLVAPGSVSGLAAAIQRLLMDPDLRNALGRRLAAEYRAHANWDVVSNAYLESCRRAIGAGRSVVVHRY